MYFAFLRYEPWPHILPHRPRCDVHREQAMPFRATLFDKSPMSNWLVAWHQDSPALKPAV